MMNQVSRWGQGGRDRNPCGLRATLLADEMHERIKEGRGTWRVIPVFGARHERGGCRDASVENPQNIHADLARRLEAHEAKE